jgi:hypothetical protein
MTRHNEALVGETRASRNSTDAHEEYSGVARPPQARPSSHLSRPAVRTSAPRLVKTALVALLAALWVHWPALGVAMGGLVHACWPGFAEA